MRNPYLVDQSKATLRPSVFAFMDILGYTQLILDSEAQGTQQTTLHELHAALTKGRKWLDKMDNEPKDLKLFGEHYDLYALKAFTDNIVIGWPIGDDAENEIGDAFDKVGAFQFQMAIEGFFVRGGISVGDAYVDDIAVFGGALIEAYEGESKLARDPRIILTSSAVETVKHHLEYYPNQQDAPHVHDLLQDADGQWFVNYLTPVLWPVDNDGEPFYEEFAAHKAAVEAKLALYQSDPPIWSKYAWVARYHNHFCDLHRHYFGAEHKIDASLFSQPFKLIV